MDFCIWVAGWGRHHSCAVRFSHQLRLQAEPAQQPDPGPGGGCAAGRHRPRCQVLRPSRLPVLSRVRLVHCIQPIVYTLHKAMELVTTEYHFSKTFQHPEVTTVLMGIGRYSQPLLYIHAVGQIRRSRSILRAPATSSAPSWRRP
jgi:hypothetical protein